MLNLLTRERLGAISSGEDQPLWDEYYPRGRARKRRRGDLSYRGPTRRTFEVLIKDIDRVAAAATMRQTPGSGNTSGAEASLALVPEEEQPNGFQYRIPLSNEEAPDTPGRDIKADGLRPAVQLAKARRVRKCSLIFKLAPTSRFRC